MRSGRVGRVRQQAQMLSARRRLLTWAPPGANNSGQEVAAAYAHLIYRKFCHLRTVCDLQGGVSYTGWGRHRVRCRMRKKHLTGRCYRARMHFAGPRIQTGCAASDACSVCRGSVAPLRTTSPEFVAAVAAAAGGDSPRLLSANRTATLYRTYAGTRITSWAPWHAIQSP